MKQIVGKMLISAIQNLLVFSFLKNSAQKQFRGNLEMKTGDEIHIPAGPQTALGVVLQALASHSGSF